MLWNTLSQSSKHIDRHGQLTDVVAGFSSGMFLDDIFKWLDDHASHGVRSLIYGTPGTISAEDPFIPCEYISQWAGFGAVASAAKYDPINNRVYDVQPAELSEKDLAECKSRTGEYMVLLGGVFALKERSDKDTWEVSDDNPLYVLSGMTDLRAKPSLNTQIRNATRPSRQAVLEYDRSTASRLQGMNGLVDVLSPQETADLFGKPVRDGEKMHSPKNKYTDISR